MDLPSGLLSVSGTAADDVIVVGTDAGDGKGSFVARYDGTGWRRLNSGSTGDLWWISVQPIGGKFYLTGENGMILEFDPATEAFESHTTPGTQTIFGIWGPAPDDIWAVGGLLSNQQFGGTIWHYDGTDWTIEDLSVLFPNGHPTMLKVWGRGADEIYAVGAAGLILRYNGTEWEQVDNGTATNPPLFSVYGDSETVVAVGGFNNGFILESANGSFTDRSSPGTIQMNGVFLGTNGSAVVVGRELNVAFRTDAGWEVQDTGLPIEHDFHACWIDPEGGVWAVGGNLISEPIDEGTLVYYGTQAVSSEFSGP